MPLIRIDLIEGPTDSELRLLLDVVHRAMLAAFKERYDRQGSS
jgi:Tautomerase enzyme